MRVSYRPNQDLPIAAEQSDDLFGEEPTEDPVQSKPAATDLSDVVPPTPADSQSVDPQPATGAAPMTESSSGIEGVAKFIPSDANLSQPVVSPSEPLGDGEARTTEDTKASDAASLEVESESLLAAASEQQATEGSKPVGADSVVAASPTPNQHTTTDPPNGITEASKPESEKAVDSSDLPNGVTAEDNIASAPASAMDIDAPQEPPPAVDTSVDQNMSDAPSSGIVRAREDDDAAEEPSAKRTKTEGDADGDSQPTFENSEPSAASMSAPAPLPAEANGTVELIRPQNTPKISSTPITKTQKSFLIEKMKNTKKVKSAFWFTKPVDYVTLNIPHYPNVIKQPMDLTTIEHKLKGDEYGSVDELVNDFELMVANCFTFNGVNHTASISAQNLRAYFLKQMQMCPTGEAAVAKPKPAKKASPKPTLPRTESAKVGGSVKSPTGGDTFALLPDGTPMIRRDSTAGRPKRAIVPPASRDLPYATSKPKRKEAQTGLKFCEHILDEFRKPKYDRFVAVFRAPVDPVALNIPTYFSVIKHPMDISTITQKMKGGQYSTATDFKQDFDLMFSNCFKFNPPDNMVHQMGKEFQQAFEHEWARKDHWIKKHTPQSQRASPASDESDGDDSDDGDDDEEHDNNEATIAMLREQLANMQNMVASIAQGGKRASPKATGNKKKKSSSGGGSKPSKKSGGGSGGSRPTIKTSSKPKKQRLVTYDEKQEISSATENMSAEQVEKLTNIITENVSKYKDMSGDDVELEIDDLPNDVQHKLLRYVRSIFPKNEPAELDANAIDDDYEPEKPSARSGGAAKKKHKPMKKHEQESRIKQLKEQMALMSGGVEAMSGGSAPAQARADSSDDDDSESSEEE